MAEANDELAKLAEEARKLDEIAELQAQKRRHENPLNEEGLRNDPAVAKVLQPQPEPEPQNNGHNIGFEDLPFSVERQTGLQWRHRTQDRVRILFNKGASYDWVLWNMMRSMAITETTAKKIIEDALRKEPLGRPK